MTAFLEAHFIYRSASTVRQVWADYSTADQHIFESELGMVCLRRRSQYPQTFAFTEGSKLFFGYGDPTLGRNIRQRPLRSVPPEDFFDAEFLYIEADAARQHVLVQRDAFNTLPIFVGANANVLSISNRFERAASMPLDSGLHADILSIAEHIMGDEHYGRTFIKEVQSLEDRVRCEWSVKGLSTIEPADNRLLQTAYDMTPSNPNEFINRLEGTINKYAQRYFNDGPVACELSGGFDSTMLAGYLADSGREVVATTLRYPGQFGQSLGVKLRDFKERFTVTHYEVLMDYVNHAPLATRMHAGFVEPFYHREELYSGSIAGTLEYLAALGAPAVMRGIGGDELCQNLSPQRAVEQGAEALHRRRQKTPPDYATPRFVELYHDLLDTQQTTRKKAVPLAAYSVLSGHLSGSNQYIEAGVWPVQPLADPELFNYCQGLPIQYRLHKNIIKAYLEARRFPQSLYSGTKRQQEHFGEFFDLAAAHNLGSVIDHFLENSVLAAHGLLDARKLHNDYRAAAARVKTATTYKEEPALFNAYVVLVGEANLRALGIRSL